MTTDVRSPHSQLPAIDRLLCDSAFPALRESHGHARMVGLLHHMLNEVKEAVRNTHALPAWREGRTQEANARLERESQNALCLMINLTGTVLHINLGRTSQAEETIKAMVQATCTPVTLEYSLDDVGRGRRDRVLADLLCRLTGAEDVHIANDSATVVLLMLAATANDKEMAVSRGEPVKVGDMFRILDAMRQAGCILCKVGTINWAYAKDYRRAVNENTGLPMKAYTSNYSIESFTKSVDGTELAVIGQELDVPVVANLGSGSLVDLSQYSLSQEPMPQQLIAADVSLVSLPGDELLGGPQAGIIVGKKEMITRLQSHPLERALRADRMTLTVLEATLRLYLHPETLVEKLPTLCQLTRSQEATHTQAQQLQTQLAKHYGDEFALNVVPCLLRIGSGSLPVDGLSSATLTFTPHDGHRSRLEALAAR